MSRPADRFHLELVVNAVGSRSWGKDGADVDLTLPADVTAPKKGKKPHPDHGENVGSFKLTHDQARWFGRHLYQRVRITVEALGEEVMVPADERADERENDEQMPLPET